MSRLSEDLHAGLAPNVLNKLFKKSIYTVLTFVRTNPELLAKITGLEYNEILKIKDAVLMEFSSTLRNGNKYYQDILSHCAILSTRIENLDDLLDSGFMTGNIYELCGLVGSGKTQICMTIAVNICMSTEQQVFFIDTKNDISAQRIFDIIGSHNVSNVSQFTDKIQICRVSSAFELLSELHRLQTRLRESKEKYLGFRLVIIDSLSALFQQFHNQSESLSVLNNVADLMKYISVEYHLVILLTNFISSWTSDGGFGEEECQDEEQTIRQQILQPALGKYWAHVPNTRLMVKKLDGSNECFIIVLKSLNQPVGKCVKVKITDAGVT